MVEDVIYDNLITKSFHFILNMVLGYFSTPIRCCLPSLAIQRWGKYWSTICLRVTLWSYFGSESECGGGRFLQYFDHKILLFYAEHGFWLFFNPKQVLRSNIVSFGVYIYLHNLSALNPKIDILYFLLIFDYTFRSDAITIWIRREKVFHICAAFQEAYRLIKCHWEWYYED